MGKNKFSLHPAANIFPMIPEDEFAKLKADIGEYGQREDIAIFRGQVLDGRNRYRACEELGIEVQWFEVENCDDPIAYVLSHNLYRRHLSQSQRAQCAAEVAKMRLGDNQHKKSEGMQSCIPTEDAAKAFSVSVRSVATAKHVADRGDRAVVDAVKSGAISVNAAAKLVDAVPDKKEQKRLVKEGKQAVATATKAAPRTKTQAKAADVPSVNEPAPIVSDDFCADMDAALSRALAKHNPHEIVIRGWLESRLRELDNQ